MLLYLSDFHGSFASGTGMTGKQGVPSIVVTDIRKTIGDQAVLAGASLSLNRGEAVGLFGRSGSGKSTLFNIILGVDRPDAGAVTLNGRDLGGLPPDARARLGLGYVPQRPFIPPRMKVADALTMAAEGAAHGGGVDAIDVAMDTVGIAHLAGRRIGQLSGGERRRTEIAYVLALRPDFLLLDEPFAGLDPISVQGLIERLKAVAASGIGLLVADHNHVDARKLTGRFYVLRQGVLVPGDQILRERERRRVRAAAS
jgi:lipopolysaccharide export system ATP-binding protein